MSTSSGRAEEGGCSRCGHSIEQHQKLKYTKCTKYKRSFKVCQAGIHGDDGVGWRICYVPCSCGEKYYPLGLSRAHELSPHEYRPGHVAYRPISPDVDDTIDETLDEAFDRLSIGDSGPSSSGAGEHVRVDSGDTDELAWDPAVTTGAGGHVQPWSGWTWEAENTRYYRSRVAKTGDWQYEYDYTTPGPETEKGKEKGKGKGKGKGKRESGGSGDELTWDESTVKQRAWSRWIWEEHNSRYYRSRQKDSGEEWEFEYDYKTDGPAVKKQSGNRKASGKTKK